MKITIKHETLLEALKLAVGMVKQKTLVTSAIELFSREGNVFMQCTNFVEGLRSKIVGATITEEGKVLVDTKRILDIVTELPSCDINIERVENKHIKIVSNVDSKIKLSILNEEFPESLFDDSSIELFWVPVKVDDLKELISFASFGASTDEIKQNIAGVYFESENEKLTAVGMDGKRLSIASRPIPEIPDGIKSLVPNNAIKTIMKILESTKFKLVHVSFTGSKFYLKCKDSMYYTQILSLNFPNFKAVIPEDDYPHNTIKLKKESLIQPLKRIQVISRESSTPTVFTITENNLSLSADNVVCGSIKESIHIDYTGDDFSFLINGDYILDLINIFSKDVNIEYDFTQDGKPIIIVPEGIDDVKAFIMPMTM